MCDDEGCGIHSRTDIEEIDEVLGEEFINRISYFGDWAILTTDNALMMALSALGKGYRPHMTLLVKVGEGTLADAEAAHPNLDGLVYDGYFTEDLESTQNTHDMLLYGLESGLNNPDTPVTPLDIVMRY